MAISDTSKITLAKALHQVSRWLLAVLIPLLLNIAIAWLISSAAKEPMSFSQMMGTIGFAPIVLLALIALGCLIARGFTPWTLLLILLVIVVTNTQGGATLAKTIVPGSVLQPLLIMVGLLAGLQIFKAIYGFVRPEENLPKQTIPAFALYVVLIFAAIFLTSHAIHDMVYPYLLPEANITTSSS